MKYHFVIRCPPYWYGAGILTEVGLGTILAYDRDVLDGAGLSNLLPTPDWDEAVVFLLYEMISGREPNEKVLRQR